jgi:Ser/Thr protein kinase RdoA (MazF antagonist)
MNPPITHYQQQLHLQKAHFSPIEHEDAIVAIVYKVTMPNGEHHILKICSHANHYFREVYFLNHFADKVPVPYIIGQVAPEKNVHGAILMECLPGQLLSISTLTPDLAFECGSALARIHLERTSSYGDLIHPTHLSADPRPHFTAKFEEGLKECAKNLPEPLIEKCRHYYAQHIHLLTSVDGPCMIHRDFRPGNVFAEHGKLSGIIDWSAGRGGFAEEDFALLEFGQWAPYKDAFLAGYASVRKVPHYHHIMPLLQLSKAVATIGFTVREGTWNSKDAKLYQANRQFLESLFVSKDS